MILWADRPNISSFVQILGLGSMLQIDLR